MYVLDTNILIYFFKGMGEVANNLLKIPPAEVGIPAIVLYELEYGIAKSSSRRKRVGQLQELTSLVNVLPFSRKEAEASAQIRYELEKKGTPIGHNDLLIAGTALANHGILVTNNTKEFKRISRLATENWF